MQLWVAWNKHIEQYADLRFRSEDTSPRDVCRWAGFPEETCISEHPEQPVLDPTVPDDNSKSSSSSGDKSHTSTRHEFSWAELDRSEEHTSELQSLMRISYAVFCLKTKR